MKVKLFAIFDKVAGVVGEPFTANNLNVAKRRFQYLMSKSEMVAQDCSLYELGTYDLETGVIVTDLNFVCNSFEEVKDEVK